MSGMIWKRSSQSYRLGLSRWYSSPNTLTTPLATGILIGSYSSMLQFSVKKICVSPTNSQNLWNLQPSKRVPFGTDTWAMIPTYCIDLGACVSFESSQWETSNLYFSVAKSWPWVRDFISYVVCTQMCFWFTAGVWIVWSYNEFFP